MKAKRPQVTVIDGQGGRMGAALITALAGASLDADVYAVGTNSAAATAMAKGAKGVATGEGAVRYAARHSDVIVGPVGIVIADSLRGEITPAMAEAVGASDAVKVLLPVNKCNNVIVGCPELPMAHLISGAVTEVRRVLEDF